MLKSQLLLANELRIGNWVNLDGKEVQVNASDILDISIHNKENSLISIAKPIPLIKKWLKDFNIKNLINKDKGGYFIWHNGEKKYIKYVHQLQNFYYALTGFEVKKK